MTPRGPESARFVFVLSAVEMPAAAYAGQCAVLARYSRTALSAPAPTAHGSGVRRWSAHAASAAPPRPDIQRSASLMFRRE